VNDDNRREALFLVGERTRLEPPVERLFAAREPVENVGGRYWFGAGDCQASAPGIRTTFLP
jgi:hypothetical protein